MTKQELKYKIIYLAIETVSIIILFASCIAIAHKMGLNRILN